MIRKMVALAATTAVTALTLIGLSGPVNAAAPKPAPAVAGIETSKSTVLTGTPPTKVGKPMAGQKLSASVRKAPPLDVSPKGGVTTQAITSCTTDCYRYNTGLQNVTSTTGVGANVVIAWPYTDVMARDPYAHSIAEIAVIQKRAGGQRDIVEMGWRSDVSAYGNDEPHLFVFHWVNGVGQGYNAGYTPYAAGPTTSTVQPGDALGSVTGSAKQMSIQYVTTSPKGWAFGYDGKWMGVIPADPAGTSTATNKWYGSGQNFTTGTQGQVFGEVLSTINEPCTDMGNGRWGTMSPHSSPYDYYSDAAYLSSFSIIGNTPSLTLIKSPATEYNYELQAIGSTGRSFYYGGGGHTVTGADGGPAGSC